MNQRVQLVFVGARVVDDAPAFARKLLAPVKDSVVLLAVQGSSQLIVNLEIKLVVHRTAIPVEAIRRFIIDVLGEGLRWRGITLVSVRPLGVAPVSETVSRILGGAR